MSGSADVVLRVLVLVLATAFLVTRLVQGDWFWAGLWAAGVMLVALELGRQVRARSARGEGNGSAS